MELSTSRRATALLRGVFEETFPSVGEDFFRVLLRRLASALGVRYALISECPDPPPQSQTRVRTLAFWMGSEFGPDCEYALSGTPCQDVVEGRGYVCHRERLQMLFPADRVLVDLAAASYMGVPLVSSFGQLLGHLAILDDRPMVEEGVRGRVLEACAQRAAAELERRCVERDREQLIAGLREAALHARTLRGLIPICAWCKKVRDEGGVWEEPEAYIRRRTEAEFTHGMCPDCADRCRSGR